MIEVSILTVVVAHPDSPSVVVLAEKSSALSPDNNGEFPEGGFVSGMNDAVAFGGAIPGLQAFETTADSPGPQLLPIWIGRNEAEAIMSLLERRPNSRPLTHDLLASVIGALGSKVKHVVIDKVTGTTFFANVCLDRDGRLIHIDARPSDSIALALRTGARIYVDEDVVNAAGRQFKVKVSDGGELLYGSDDEMERFHSFIESISPEDFLL